MTIKELFNGSGGNALTWEQFQKAAGDAKFVDLTEGKYVSKQKFDDEVGTRDDRIKALSETISTRDSDLAAMQQKLTDAGDIDALKQAATELAALQAKYDREKKEYQKQLAQQAYEFAVRDYANDKHFTSQAAKRDFVSQMIAKKLSMEDGRIIGADDFTKKYSEGNEDAFASTEPSDPKPKFAERTTDPQLRKLTLSEMMKMKNANPEVVFDI